MLILAMTNQSNTKIRLKGRELVMLRAKKAWTQKQAAKKAKISLPTYLNAEKGMELHAAKAGMIAKLYKVDLEDLEDRCA
jgi:DNA-binding XRE family transcriptional regulator